MRSIVLSFSLFALVGCSSSTTTTSSGAASSAASADPTDLCSTVCSRNAACDSSVDAETCTKKCQNDGGGVRRYRADLVQAVASCYQTADCKQVLSSNGLSSCVDDAAVSVAPTAATRSFCDAFESAAIKCDSTLDHAKCLGLMKLFSDDTLQGATHCFDKSCSTMSACLDAELGN